MSKIILDSHNVKLVGRTCLIDDTLWMALSGTGAAFTYTGKELNVTFVGDGAAVKENNGDNQARAAVYVDGERVVDVMIDSAEKTVTVFSSETEKTVSVQIIKLSECAMSTLGVKPLEIADGEKISPAADKKHKIEFIGDSITCGYGVDDEDENHHFSTTTEDVTRAYAYKTAQLLDADYSMFSTSGYGIITGYTTNDQKIPEQTIPQFYQSMGFSYNSFADKQKPSETAWDFSAYVPELVVINLGTNDDSYCQGQDERHKDYAENYVKFLKLVREKNPGIKIIMTVGIMGQRIFPAVELAKELYTKETGDENVVTYLFDEQVKETDGLVADFHPTEKTHEKASKAFAEFIRSEMGW